MFGSFQKSEPHFSDRRDAGRALAMQLRQYAGRDDVVVLALPRGGVPVGYEVAKELHAPLDVFIVRKLGVPGYEELAMGAIAAGGVRVLNKNVVAQLPDADQMLDYATEKETRELDRRALEYRDGRAPRNLRGETVILVDDGLATGASMRAAAMALRQFGIARCVIGVPVASRETCAELGEEADEIVCVITPEPFYGVGQFYQDFSQTSDDEVRELLATAAAEETKK
ncbi:MAG TPA: phosphoribosyltransferase [Chthoniobacterales bacterium]|jgi:predicted phosphoribosyltransferase